VRRQSPFSFRRRAGDEAKKGMEKARKLKINLNLLISLESKKSKAAAENGILEWGGLKSLTLNLPMKYRDRLSPKGEGLFRIS